MKLLGLVGAVVAAALWLSSAAEAKLCVRIAAPASAVEGEAVTVSVTTLMPIWKSGRFAGGRPVSAGTMRLTLVLSGPNGEYREVALRRVAGHPALVRASVRFARVGTWRLSVRGWDYAPRGCADARRVRVAAS